jgi:hypothetical protein
MSKKPCIQCGNDCDILPVQLGDLFTLCYLRVCDGECMFLIAYEFMRNNREHKQFRGKLYDMQNEEDKQERDDLVNVLDDEFLRRMRENFETNPNLLSHPVPQGIVDMFKNNPGIPCNGGTTMKFIRPSKQDRVRWANDHVNRLKKDLRDALHELERLENE